MATSLLRPSPNQQHTLRSKLPDANNQQPSDPDLESDPIKPDRDRDRRWRRVLGVRRLEEAIHSIVVRKLAPDWLLFVPGSSYWVPPPPRRSRSSSVEEVVGRMRRQMMSAEEEKMSLKSARGWPSKAYFVEGVLPQPVKKTLGKVVSSLSDDEES
ncbi:uncharacterized protein M6B38_168095 [Iris pallida]|uniref:Uncharacterized protein n=1 Tax=Iris pallida TaxID=29817 RepID=A0AAX6EW48_IRIPA|nr:uncharacterized protein M6B38_168095 [Iris pallida]